MSRCFLIFEYGQETKNSFFFIWEQWRLLLLEPMTSIPTSMLPLPLKKSLWFISTQLMIDLISLFFLESMALEAFSCRIALWLYGWPLSSRSMSDHTCSSFWTGCNWKRVWSCSLWFRYTSKWHWACWNADNKQE